MAKFYSWHSLKCINEFRWSTTISCLAVSPNQQFFASGSTDGKLKVGELNTGNELFTFTKWHKTWIHSIVISPDNKLVITGGQHSIIKVWSFESKQEIYNTKKFAPIKSIAVDRSGQFIVYGDENGLVEVLTLPECQPINTFKGHSRSINSVTISNDSSLIVSSSEDGSIKIWDFWKEKEIVTLKGPSYSICSASINSDKNIVAGSDGEGQITIWNLNTRQRTNIFKCHSEPIMSIMISPDSQTFISSSSDRTIKLWDLTTGKEIKTLMETPGGIPFFAVSLDGQIVVCGDNRNKIIKVWKSL